MGLMRDRKIEDEYAKILEDMGLELPEDVVIEDKSKEENKNEK